MYLWRVPYSTHGGLLAKAAPGTHEAVAKMIGGIGNRKSLLDLGAGTGALLSRLGAMGFQKKVAIERDAKLFDLPSVQRETYDLNQEFADKLGEKFSCVTAIEIIEHLDSPRMFLEEIYKSLEIGGCAVVSTPNLGHWLSRLQFLFTGVPKYFTQKDFSEQRHISPILDHHMEIMVKEIGFKLVEKETTASSWGLGIHVLTAPLSLPFLLLGGKKTQGNVNLYLLKKL